METLRFRSCRARSLYRLVERLVPGDEERIPFARICGLARKYGARSYLEHSGILESPDFLIDYGPAVAEIKRLKRLLPRARFSITQVTFFACEIPESRKSLPEWIEDSHILSTTVIIRIDHVRTKYKGLALPRAYVFEAVVGFPSRPLTPKLADPIVVEFFHLPLRERLSNNYHHIGGEITVVVGGSQFDIQAAYFCQQNGIDSWCGHATMRMALWNLPGIEQVDNGQVINAVNGKHQKDRMSSSIFRLEDINAVCRDFGLTTISYDCSIHPQINPYEYAYMLVESGIPTIIAFVTHTDEQENNETLHVLPVIGHTMNTDEWLPGAIRRYKVSSQGNRGLAKPSHTSSIEWAPHLIVHDDLLGPYLCINASAFPVVSHPNAAMENGRVRAVIGLLNDAKKIPEHPYVVQQVAAGFMLGMRDEVVRGMRGPWKARLAKLRWNKQDVVLRTQLIERDEYIEFLLNERDHEENASGVNEDDVVDLRRLLKPRMWMTEISLPELFTANKARLGEILLPLKLTERHVKALDIGNGPAPLLYRLVNHVLLADGSSKSIDFRSHVLLHTVSLNRSED